MTRNGTARVRIDQLEGESQAVKQIALGGGGPAEQRAAIENYASGRRGAPATTATAQAAPQPPVPAPPPPPPPPPPPAPTPAPTPPVTVYPSSPRSPAVAPAEPPVLASRAGGGAPTIASIAAASVPPPAGGAAGGGFYVQTGAFSTAGNAEKQRSQITSYGSVEISQASSAGREVYRVRLGPYSTQEAAGMVADRLKRSGYGDARVVAD